MRGFPLRATQEDGELDSLVRKRLRAPSTLGEFLRSFTHGHVRQLQAAARRLQPRLAVAAPLLSSIGALCFVDVDSMLRRVYGKQKQGAAFGYTKVGGYDVRLRGLHPLLATVSTPLSAPVVAAARLRAGNAASAPGAAPLIAEAINTARGRGRTRPVRRREGSVRPVRRGRSRRKLSPAPNSSNWDGRSSWRTF